MTKALSPLLLLFSLSSIAQNNNKPATVTFVDGTRKVYLVQDRQALVNPRRFTLNDLETGKPVVITPLEARTISVKDGDTWTGAILDVDQTPIELTNEQLSGTAPKFNPRRDTVFLLNEFNGTVLNLYSLQDRRRTHLFLTKLDGPYEELIYHHFVVDEDGRPAERENRRYQVQVAQAVRECPLIADATESLRFSPAVIAELLANYEMNCLKSPKAELRADRQKGKLDIAPMIGYSLNRPEFSSTNLNDLIPPGPVKVAGTPSFGISFTYNLPVLKYRLAFGTDIYYNRFNGHSDTVRRSGASSSYYLTQSLDYQVSTIRTNLNVQYFLTDPGGIRPFLKLGFFALGYSFSHNATVHEWEYFSNVLHPITRKDPFEEQGFRGTQFGFAGGAGVQISRFTIQYKYEAYSGYVQTLNTNSSLGVHSLFLSYTIN